MATERGAARRRRIKKLIAEGDVDGVVRWARTEPTAAALLIARTCERDDLLRWRATVALGRVAGERAAEGDLEAVREVVRRLLWLMNDESGGLAWHGPEAIAEVLANVPELIREYGVILASFIDQEPFVAGVHWAVARLCHVRAEYFDELVEVLADSLGSDDAFVRGHALIALTALCPRAATARADGLVEDRSELTTFAPGAPVVGATTVANLAQAVVAAEPSSRHSSVSASASC